MIIRRTIYLLALIGSLTFYMIYQEWVSWILLLIAIFFPLLSFLLSLGAMVGLRMRLDVPAQVSMGYDEPLQLKVSSNLPLPPYKTRFRITKPLTGESWTLKPGAKLPAEHCGKLHIKLHKPGVFDYLGIFRLPLINPPGQAVLVLPKPVEMEIPQNLIKCLIPRWRQKPGGGFSENHEIRQYQPGDNLNQIHWKLSAKVGELMLREPMEPERGLMLLTMDLNGTAAVLDRKLGQLLWLSQWLLEHKITFDVRVLTANGIGAWTLRSEEDVNECITTLLGTPSVRDGSIRDKFFRATWQYHIGGEQHES